LKTFSFAVQEISQKPMVFGALKREAFGASQSKLTKNKVFRVFEIFYF
jgi:hypothetical protein